MEPAVVTVARDSEHRFSKQLQERITLRAGLGVEGDAHAGVTVQHRSRVAADPTRPNLRQVHLLASEFLSEAAQRGYDVGPGDMGENILTAGIDLLGLPVDTVLRIGPEAVVRLTGLRNPCVQIDRFRRGLLGLAVTRDESGRIVRKAGVMGIVVASGVVRPGDTIGVELPAEPHKPLERV